MNIEFERERNFSIITVVYNSSLVILVLLELKGF